MAKNLYSMITGQDSWHLPNGLHVADGPNGVVTRGHKFEINTTCFPQITCLGATWDIDLVFKMASSIGEEASQIGVDIILGPCADIIRHPLSGRNFECFSDNVILICEMISSYVKGIQSTGIGCCVKHFIYRNIETDRKTADFQINETELRNIYLPPFKAAIDAGVLCIMSAYNSINGEHASQNKYLLSKILREEWKFKGIVMSDWGGCPNHDSAIEAGLDVKMPGPPTNFNKNIKLAKNSIIRQEWVMNQIKKFKKNNSIDRNILKKSKKVSIEVSIAGTVLMKNNKNVLPFIGNKLIVVGSYSRYWTHAGGGSSFIPIEKTTNPVEILKQNYYGKIIEIPDNFELMKIKSVILEHEDESIIVIYAGFPYRFEGEKIDRKDALLPHEQNLLINELTTLNKRVVVILNIGSQIEMPWFDKVDGVLVGWYTGVAETFGIVNIMTGISEPTGRLPFKWEPRFNIGFGLSYNKMVLTNIKQDCKKISFVLESVSTVRTIFVLNDNNNLVTFSKCKQGYNEILCDILCKFLFDGENTYEINSKNST